MSTTPTTPQWAIEAAKEIAGGLFKWAAAYTSDTDAIRACAPAIIAKHAQRDLAARDAELARLREQVKQFESKLNYFTDATTKPHSIDDATMREWDLANELAKSRAQLQTATERAERAEAELKLHKAWIAHYCETDADGAKLANLRAVADGLAEALDDLIGVARAAMKQPESEFNVNAELEPAINALARYRAASADGHARKEEA